jgi:hypothetical protein
MPQDNSTLEVWPDESVIPQVSSVSYSGTQQANTVRTAMDSGTIRQRRRFSVEMFSVDCTWELSDDEFGIFAAFHNYYLNLGSDWFMIQIPLGGMGVVTCQARFQNGAFKQQYEDVSYWTITATLDILSRPIMDQTTLDFILATGGLADQQNLIDALSGLHTLVHVTLPQQLN